VSEEEFLKLALEHSRPLFIYHATQRITSLNYYFVAIAVFLSGFGFVAASTLEPEERALVGLVLSISGIILTSCFMGLDRRNIQLVGCNEKLLTYAEDKMATLSGCKEWNIMACADKAEPRKDRYGKIVPRIFKLYLFLSIVGGIFAAWPWAAQLLDGH
jgi:hypothetical protein